MDMLDTPIGDIAREQPSSTRVFLRRKLDFCCGGRRTLREACVRAGVDPDEVVDELKHAPQRQGADIWSTCSQADLVAHIIDRYHEALRRDMPPLIEAARKVERVHADKEGVPIGLANSLDEFWAEMQRHMTKEEQVLFPMLARGARGGQIYMPVRVMEHEHDEHAAHLARLREVTDGYTAPAHACATWRALYQGLDMMEQELLQHIHLENNVLFPRATGGQ